MLKFRVLPQEDGITTDGSVEASQEIARALGLPYPQAQWWMNLELTQEHKDKLLLPSSSPHLETLLKVMQIKQEVPHD